MPVSIGVSITQNSQNVANNTSNVTVNVTAYWTYGSYNHYGNCTGSITIDGTAYSFSGMVINPNRTQSGNAVVMTKTVNVGHNADGTKSLAVSTSFDTQLSKYGVLTASASKTLTTIPRASGLSVSDGTLGVAQTITADRKASVFTHTLKWSSGAYSGTIATKSSGTSWSFTPALNLANGAPNGLSVTVSFTLETYTGDALVGSVSKSATMTIPASVVPSCSLAVSDATGAKSQLGQYVQGVSKLDLVVTAAGSYGSKISSYKIVANGETYTSASAQTGTIKTADTQTITATVTDSRGRTKSATVSISVAAYSAPKITLLNVHRCDASGNEDQSGGYALVTYSYGVASVVSASAILRYKKTTESQFTEVALPGTGSVEAAYRIIPASDDSSYDVEISVADPFNTTTRKTSVSTGFTLFHFGANGRGLAIGKVAERDGLDIGMPTYFRRSLGAETIPERADFNDLLIVGKYVVKTNALILAMSNRPCDSAGSLYVISPVDPDKTSITGPYEYLVQVFLTYTGEFYSRQVASGGSGAALNYTPWKKIGG